MAERYSRLFSLPENLYQGGSPVIIAAGALLKDNQTGRVLAQLKFRSISDEIISAIKILVRGYDMSDEPVCQEEHQYLDLQISRDGTWGAKEAITLPDNSVRSFSVQVLTVHFNSRRCWNGEDEEWTPIIKQQEMDTVLFDRELIKQYRLETTEKSRFVLARDRDLWLCSCGAVNHTDDRTCHICRQSPENLYQALNLDFLREQKNERIMQEMEQEALAEAERAKRADKVKRAALIAGPVLAVVIIAVIVAVFFSGLNSKYDRAMALYNAEKYTEASSAFQELRSFKDSREMADKALQNAAVESSYIRANNLLESGSLSEAAAAFYVLGDYKDSPELMERAKTELALSLIEEGKEDEAAAVLEELGEDSDGADKARELYYNKAKGYLAAGELEKAQYCFTKAGTYFDAAQQAQAFMSRLQSEYISHDEYCGDELTTKYEYGSDGRLAKVTRLYSAVGGIDVVGEYRWNKDGSYSVVENGEEKMYDDMGSLIGINGEQKYTVTYEYYGNGELFSSLSVTAEDESFVEETLYDEKGAPVQITSEDGDITEIQNEYTDGRLSQQIWLVPHKDAYVLTFQYNDEGQLIRKTKVTGNGNPVYTEYTYGTIYAPDAK